MKRFEIYFNDLNEEAQAELLKLAGIESPKEANWDINLVPLAVFDFEEDAFDEE